MEELINGLTEEEMKAIGSLERLAKKFPASLTLFSWSGTLCVCKKHPDDEFDDNYDYDYRVITAISGIANDGGDPDLKDWND